MDTNFASTPFFLHSIERFVSFRAIDGGDDVHIAVFQNPEGNSVEGAGYELQIGVQSRAIP